MDTQSLELEKTLRTLFGCCSCIESTIEQEDREEAEKILTSMGYTHDSAIAELKKHGKI